MKWTKLLLKSGSSNSTIFNIILPRFFDVSIELDSSCFSIRHSFICWPLIFKQRLYMRSSKLITDKTTNARLSNNKMASSALAKKIVSIHPLAGHDITSLFPIEGNTSPKKCLPAKLKMQDQADKDFGIAPRNKIYNAQLSKHTPHPDDSNLIKRSKADLANSAKLNGSDNFESDTRPKSSNPQKWLKPPQTFLPANPYVKPQLRPGSSKSSRLFKRKSALLEDSIKSQNDEFDDSLIKLNIRQSESNMALERTRIGTSMGKKPRGLSQFQSKLDPLFFNLFAS